MLFRIQRGLVGFVSYLTACEMKVYSEYVLRHEPILRIMMASGYSVSCECPFSASPPAEEKEGDHKRIDFRSQKGPQATRTGGQVAQEIDSEQYLDYAKLLAFRRSIPDSQCFVRVRPMESHQESNFVAGQFKPRLEPLYAY